MTTGEPKHVPIPQDASLLPVHRAIFACTQQLQRLGSRFIESFGLTPSQFDVLVTLGDTEGMLCKTLSKDSLIFGGTLNPVVERLAAKGLVKRAKGELDCRQTIVALTPEGQALYERMFPAFVAEMRGYQSMLTDAEQDQLATLLRKLTAGMARVRQGSP